MNNNKLIKPISRQVFHNVAVPARKRDVLLWLVSAGKYGRLFVAGKTEFTRWESPTHINYRCVQTPIIILKDGQEQSVMRDDAAYAERLEYWKKEWER